VKITKSQLRQIIKEELQTELFGFGKKKEKGAAPAASKGNDQQLTDILLKLAKLRDAKEFAAVYNENPGLFASAVRLGVEGLPKDNRFRNPLLQKYKPYIDKLNNKPIDQDNLSTFGDETKKFVFALQDYAKDEMDPNLKQLAKNLENIR
tara:strand:- start:373 stop:822 length:450 start_codon:yes stop_codon:yes gene_type:complete